MTVIPVCAACKRPVPKGAERLECPECMNKPAGTEWVEPLRDDPRHYERECTQQVHSEKP